MVVVMRKIVRDLVYGVIFSLDTDCMFVEGYTMRNIVLLGLYIALFLFEGQIIVESWFNF